MGKAVQSLTLGEIASLVGGVLNGPADAVVASLTAVGQGNSDSLTFANDDVYLRAAEATDVGAVLIGPDMTSAVKPTIAVENPRSAFGLLLHRFQRPLPYKPGIHPTACVSSEASVHPEASVGPYVVIEQGAVIEKGVRIFPQCYIGESCKVGEQSIIYPQVTLSQDVRIGARCIIHSGAVIGADGFGFVWDGSKRQKIPQIGGVVIGDDVEVGANTCIDRATAGDVIIGDGVKIDNLVQIAHNVVIGDHTVMAAMSAIAGSSTVGKRVIFGGGARISDHIKITDDVVLAGNSAGFSDINEPGEYMGSPHAPLRVGMRVLALTMRLPDMYKRLKDLESRVFPRGKN